MISDEEKEAFLGSVARVRLAVGKCLGLAPDGASAVGFIGNLHDAIDKVGRENRDAARPPACTAGCDSCCSLRVEASEPEILLIARELKRWPATELDALLQRLRSRQAVLETGGTNPPRIDCAFLVNHRCTIYPIRPAVCRKAHSLSAERCQEFAADLPQNLEVVLAAEALIKGTAEAYRQCGLPASAHELCTAVLLALTDDTAEARWQRGEAVLSRG